MDERSSRGQRLLVEEFGLLYEDMGGTRMAGRMSGWLLLCDPPVQSLTQIADGLGVSKAAVSTAARSLLQAGVVERVSEPGARGDYYRSLPGPMETVLGVNHALTLKSLVDRGLELVADKDQTQSNYILLGEISAFLAFLEGEIPGLLARWNEHRKAAPASTGAQTTDIPTHGGTK
ncbi:MAG TPA: MarR family transcriptional regulator [Thermoleophilia bacterium]|nr:MarR family transcriptional regulator [Thermoleophilia bacterium]